MNAGPVVSIVTPRQQQWCDAHERAEQQVGDLFVWWCSMRAQGRITETGEPTLADQLRSFNAVQVTPLPMSGDD
ncbi:hypothetical protein [Paraburkholderia sp. MM5477-R1]|uniref:hypothetical protein n=1 Tax=Paraburkholderia sp. MM5477-R1 TaxID=2991062 RepID=UPI003D1E222F